MDSIRQNKVSKVLLKEISGVLSQKFSHLFLGSMVTVTACKVSSDLSSCRVFLSIFAGAPKEEVLKSINDSQKDIRFELGKIIKNQLRIVPLLHFVIDDSLERAARIDELLKK